MVSYFQFELNRKGNPYDGTFSEFLRDPRRGLAACIRHYRSWLPRISFLIQYEELITDARNVMESMLRKVGTRISPEILIQAVERSEFKEVRRQQVIGGPPRPKRMIDPGEYLARSGRTGQWKEMFSVADNDFFDKIAREEGFDLYL
jgi:hypothetical protein